MKLILLGPPGAGKGTLASLLKENFPPLVHISTGDIFRQEMKARTKIGREIKKLVDNGQLVPDEVVTRIIQKKMMQKSILAKGFILDGFPRTETQAEDLDKILEKVNASIDRVLYLDAGLATVIQRLGGRRVCRQCGAVFHVDNRPPAQAGVCDACGGELHQRADDNEETIRKRMEVYLDSTQPIIDYYDRQKKLIRLDANKEVEEIYAALKKFFDENK